MNNPFFIVGDVHGCLYTLSALLTKWNPQKEQLIFVGDIIDRGKYSPQVISLILSLRAKLPVIVLKGNHEYEMIKHLDGGNEKWIEQSGHQTLLQYEAANTNPYIHFIWIKKLPLFFENNYLHISHAGISHHPDPYGETNPKSVLWNRTSIKNLGKIQVYGHTPKSEARYYPEANAWCIDTGAAQGNALSAILIDSDGSVSKIYRVPSMAEDLYP